MNFYELIGKEISGKFVELEVEDWENEDMPNCILFQGTWETTKGEFSIDYEWLTDERRISWLRVSQITNSGDKVVFESDELADFKNRYPKCWNDLTTYAMETRQ